MVILKKYSTQIIQWHQYPRLYYRLGFCLLYSLITLITLALIVKLKHRWGLFCVLSHAIAAQQPFRII